MKSLMSTWIALGFALLSSQIRVEAQEHPDRIVQPGVPQGKVTSGQLTESKIYPGTKRDYSVYVPAQYKAEEPAALMVFMDGSGYANTKGGFRVPVVFDNLIHQKLMPVTVAVFVNPGMSRRRSPVRRTAAIARSSTILWAIPTRSSSSTNSCP